DDVAVATPCPAAEQVLEVLQVRAHLKDDAHRLDDLAHPALGEPDDVHAPVSAELPLLLEPPHLDQPLDHLADRRRMQPQPPLYGRLKLRHPERPTAPS